MPRKRELGAPPVVHRTARCGLRVTRAQRGRLFGLLRSAGDVWCCVLELNRWRRQRRDAPLAGYRELCRELAAAGPGTFGELDSAGARSVLRRDASRRHNQRTRDWRLGHLIRALTDKAEAAGITVALVDERGTSSTCPRCARRVPKPGGRNFNCPHCGHHGHRDLTAAANIAARNGGGTIPATAHGAGITHRRAGTHLPGVHPARRDPRRRPHHGRPPTVPWPAPARPPRQPPHGESLATQRGARKPAAQPRRTYRQMH
jgi:putative transposase